AVYGTAKLDEISTCCDTLLCENNNGTFTRYTVKPEDFGFTRCEKADLVGGTPEENAAITLAILNGEKGPKRDTVLLNAGAGLYIGGVAKDMAEGVKMAAELIDSGAAREKLEAYIQASKQ
ncbi:MAG: anthranilate phosphoribosyltransferase, partial [Lachnospiraceae bacterium]|nr:anthranilate phosphoribosyltransferase [Lachnospiraceae bacterium]